MKAVTSRYAGAAFCVSVVLITGLNCRAKPEPDYNGLGAALVQEARWDEAAELFKQRLLRDPRDVVAHFNLGRCYLNGSVFYPAAAEGEFHAALQLFLEAGRHSPIAEYSDQYFELRCHLELAKVYLRLCQGYAAQGVPTSRIQPVMAKMKKAADAARAIDPESEDVRQLESIIQAL